MSSIPASAITSASPIFWQVMPLAPAATCICASIGLLWVLICGRLATPALSQATWMRAMLRSTRSMSITAQGVPYSRAIFAARGVVMLFSLEFVGWVERSETHQFCRSIFDGYRCAPPILRSGLLYLFAQHFQLQPSILGRRQLFLRLCDRRRSRVEFLAILGVEVGIVKQLLLFGNLGLQ